MASNKSGAEKELMEKRKLESFDLRVKGNSYRAIGLLLGVSEHTAFNDVKGILKSMLEDRKEDIEEMRAVENHRLDVLFDKVYKTATDVEFSPFTEQAVRACIALMKRRADLNGLDMPVKIALTDKAGEDMIYVLPEREIADFEVVEPTNGENGKELTDGNNGDE